EDGIRDATVTGVQTCALPIWKVKQVHRSIVLIGMMGAGKSSVGRCLRRRMGLALLDIDEVVASNFGMSIPEIFAEYGEKKFRERSEERRVGKECRDRWSMVY